MLNRAILMGRLVADPELRQTPNGVSVTAFRIAVNRNYNRDMTDWIDIVAWRQTAEFVTRYFQKGSMIIVEGSIQTRNYEDKNGNKRTAVEVVADQVYFAESKGAAQRQTASSFPVPSEMDEPAKGTSFSVGDMSDYEELDSDDSDLPF